MDPSLASLQSEVITGFSHLLANKYYVLASTVLILYDHILTFDQEREFIWKKKKTLPTCLFLIFRYVTPIVSALNIIALNWPGWKGSICKNWIWLPVAVGPIISAATGTQLAVMGWSIPAGSPAPLPPGFIGCVPSEKEGTGRRLSALYIAALCFDASVFLLTFSRAVYARVTGTTVPLLQLVVRDGTLYFMVIFAVNLVNVFLLSLAPPDLSAINAPFASLITAVLVARLFLNLREAAQQILKSNSNSETLQWTSNYIGVWHSEGQSHAKDTRPSATFVFTGYNEFEAPLSISGQDSEGGSGSRETYGPSNGLELPDASQLQAV
ncbi:hypothetical protein M422DRAFT_260732 [Sphaerobolus stellatus SS14]|uniref:DUF6533 domain-containing protein n=1 Tax=Sphaerobolus stellatus (strain SS14) TaxID=990650 RepID=A0A0C9V5K1_SPHS4|nr:hypothetical protein M422DRAFT_260732 [Sphaerobolus stellatus SS14]